MAELACIIVTPEQIGARVDFVRLFGNDRPVEMEIGCGKGGFLLQQARRHPERNYFGVEWAGRYFRYAADRMRRWGLANVRLIRADARYLVMHQLPPGCLAALHVYHPDPWPKRRHHKRRLFQPDFVAAAVRALRPGARWRVQTDHEAYVGVMKSLLEGRPELEPADFADPECESAEDGTQTNFEIKYVQEGRTIYRLAFCRRADGAAEPCGGERQP
jgi:tRNA (guanine-N7-)-methyltransferase